MYISALSAEFSVPDSLMQFIIEKPLSQSTVFIGKSKLTEYMRSDDFPEKGVLATENRNFCHREECIWIQRVWDITVDLQLSFLNHLDSISKWSRIRLIFSRLYWWILLLASWLDLVHWYLGAHPWIEIAFQCISLLLLHGDCCLWLY